MDTLHIIINSIVGLLAGGTIPFLIKLYRDKKKLKEQQERIQNKKIELLGEIIVEYINDNGSSVKAKNKCNRLYKQFKRVGGPYEKV